MTPSQHLRSQRATPYVWATIGAAVVLLLVGNGVVARTMNNAGYVLLNKALATGESARLEQAAAVFERTKSDSWDGQRAWRGVGLAKMGEGSLEGAVAAWAQVEGFDAEAQRWGGRAVRGRDLAAARAWYTVATSLEPANGDHWYRLGGVLANLGETDAASDAYAQALLTERAAAGRSNVLARLGELAKRAEQPDWAAVLDYHEQALRLDDFVDQRDAVLAQLGRAEALERLGRSAEALDAYRQLVDRQPNHYWANVHSGRLTWQVEKDAHRAAAYLQKAIEVDGKPKWAYLNLGIVYEESGDAARAVPLYEKVLTVDPSDRPARERLNRLRTGDGSQD